MDVRYAIRTLRRTPGFTAMAVATLALGIGINTVVFTIYGSVAFRQLPVRAPEEMVRFQWRSGGSAADQFSWSEYERLAARVHSFTSVIATSTPQTIVGGLPGASEIIRARFVSPNYFGALGIQPRLGRWFGSGESAVAIVSHNFWKTKLKADPDICGKTLRVQRTGLSIVGVAPDKFAGTGAPPQEPDVWIPASAQPLVMPGIDWMHDATSREWQVLARARSEVKPTQGSAELAVLSAEWPFEAGKPVQLSAVHAMFFQTSGGAFEGFAAVCGVLAVAVGLILLMACVNLVNLIETRNSGRTHEVAVRLALGAGRWRLIRQFCTESLILGVMGGIAGLLVSVWASQWLAAKAAELVQEIANGAMGVSLDISPDWRVFLLTATLSVTTGIAVGILPALRASRGDINSTLKQGAISRGGCKRRRNLLLSAQVASCLILLAAAGLLFRGALRAAASRTGFERNHLVLVGMDTRTIAGTADARLDIQRQALRRMEALPEVESAAWADRAPFLGTGSGLFRNESNALLACIFNGVSDRYFETLDVPLVAGRAFTNQEIEQQAGVAVISQATATRLWAGKDPLGHQIAPATAWLASEVGRGSFTVIGVAKTVRSTYLSKEDEGYVYIPRRLHEAGGLFLLRSRVMPEQAFPSISAALSAINTNLPAHTYIVSVEQGPVRIQELMAQAPAVAASVLGSLALVLACLGIYGVVSHLVSQRTREIGIRMALGADRLDVVGLVGAETLKPVGWGAVAGLAGALGVSGLLRALIVMPDAPDLTYGAGAFDPVIFFGAVFLLVAVVMFAAFLPMRRATAIEPAIALRDE